MRILIAPDKFAGTLTALEAARAMAEGWSRVDASAALDLVPLSDGGPGFAEVMAQATEGATVTATVTGPLGAPVSASYALTPDGSCAYIESAQACGLHLVPSGALDPEGATTRGVGELIAHARGRGAATAVIGLGGSATNDGGAGMLAALGATPGAALAGGARHLPRVPRLDLAPARAKVRGMALVAATDVDHPLLGESGASSVFGPQKGADAACVARMDAALADFAAASGAPPALSEAPGAGAAGGLGYGLLLLGAQMESGVRRVLHSVDLASRVARSDLVLTGEGSFDDQSLRGKLPHGVARLAAERGTACVVLAGQVTADLRRAREEGVHDARSLARWAGSVQAALADPARGLSSLAGEVAEEWRPRPALGGSG